MPLPGTCQPDSSVISKAPRSESSLGAGNPAVSFGEELSLPTSFRRDPPGVRRERENFHCHSSRGKKHIKRNTSLSQARIYQPAFAARLGGQPDLAAEHGGISKAMDNMG